MSAPTSAVRVLMVTVAGERGGAEVVMTTLAARLDRTRAQVWLGVPAGSQLEQQWRPRHDVVALPPWPSLRRVDQFVALVGALREAIDAYRIDVLHTHGIAAQMAGGIAGALTGTPVVWHFHDLLESRWNADGLLHRAASLARWDVLLAISETVAGTLRPHVRADRLVIVPNGVDDEAVPLVARAGSGPLIVWCGRLQRWKGAHIFLRAARLVHDARPAARFAVVGGPMFGMESDYPAELHALAGELGLTGVLTFTGAVSDARPWLAAAAVLVHSSERPEPFGLVVVEAMMQARPVVAFRQGGPAETIVDGATGYLVPPLDVDAMALAIIRLIDQPELAIELGAAGRRRALDHYDADSMTRKVEDAYDLIRSR